MGHRITRRCGIYVKVIYPCSHPSRNNHPHTGRHRHKGNEPDIPGTNTQNQIDRQSERQRQSVSHNHKETGKHRQSQIQTHSPTHRQPAAVFIIPVVCMFMHQAPSSELKGTMQTCLPPLQHLVDDFGASCFARLDKYAFGQLGGGNPTRLHAVAACSAWHRGCASISMCTPVGKRTWCHFGMRLPP